MNRHKYIKRIILSLFIVIMFLSFTTRVYSGGGHGTGTGANTNVNGTGNSGGPGVRAHRTGWIMYLVWMVDDEKIGAVKNTLVTGSERAVTLSAGSGSDGNDSFTHLLVL